MIDASERGATGAMWTRCAADLYRLQWSPRGARSLRARYTSLAGAVRFARRHGLDVPGAAEVRA